MENLHIDVCLFQDELEFILKALIHKVSASELFLQVSTDLEDSKKIKVLEEILFGRQMIEHIQYSLNKMTDNSSV